MNKCSMRKPFRIHVSTISKSHRVAPSSTSTDVSCGRFASSPSTPAYRSPPQTGRPSLGSTSTGSSRTRSTRRTA